MLVGVRGFSVSVVFRSGFMGVVTVMGFRCGLRVVLGLRFTWVGVVC